MKNRFFVLALGLILSFAGLTAAEPRTPLAIPTTEPTISRFSATENQLEIRWETSTNKILLSATFEGEDVSELYFIVGGDRPYEYPTNKVSSRKEDVMWDSEVEAFTKIAKKIREQWRTVGEVAYEAEPYTLAALTWLPNEDKVLIFKRGESYLGIPSDLWMHWNPPALGEKVLVGQAGFAFCPITLVYGSPKVPEEMLKHLREWQAQFTKK